MAMFRNRSERLQDLGDHPRKRFVRLVIFASIIALWALLRFIFLFKNYPGQSTTCVLVAIVSAVILIPNVNIIFSTKLGRDSQIRKVALGILVLAALIGLPLIYGWTSVFPSYTSHHWLEVPLDIEFIAFGTMLLVTGIRRRLWLPTSQRQRQG
jgi:hypothetical protein